MRTREVRKQSGFRRVSDAEKRRRLDEWRRLQRQQIEREGLRLFADRG